MEENNPELITQINELQTENKELKTQLSINKNIIQDFFNKTSIDDKISLIIEDLKKEKDFLLSQIENLKSENSKLKKISINFSSKKKDLDVYECKLFVYENMLKEKQNTIVLLKNQINNIKNNFLSNFKNIKYLKPEENNTKNSPTITNNKNENKFEENLLENNKNTFIIEEVCVIPPDKVFNTLNSKIELYKSINQKLKNIINELKQNLSEKENEYLKLEENSAKVQKELAKFNQFKNNEEIINKLIQYQSMKQLPLYQSCSNLYKNNNYFSEKEKNKKLIMTKSSEYILHNKNKKIKNKKILDQINQLENINKTVKEITNENLNLNGEWEETLKYCNMTQEEFSKYFNIKTTSKLASAIEYLYTILVDKNIQIKLLTQENETLNEENIRLNKINLELESIIEYNKNKKSRNRNYSNKIKHKEIRNIKNNILFKNSFLNTPPSKHNSAFLDNLNINTTNNKASYVNVDNNITHTNININMLMDYDYTKKEPSDNNYASVTSSEFRDGILLAGINDNDFNSNTVKNLKVKRHSENKTENINKIKNNFNGNNFKKIILNSKSQSKVILNNKKIRNKTPCNLSVKNLTTQKNMTNDSNNNKLNEYNNIIKSIFNKTDKPGNQSVGVFKKNTSNKKQLVKFNRLNSQDKKIVNSNIDSNIASNFNSNLNSIKLFNRDKCKKVISHSDNAGNKCFHAVNKIKNDTRVFEVFRKYIKETKKYPQNKNK